MEKIIVESENVVSKNVEKIVALFPNCITETRGEDGKLKKAINFETLQQMLSEDVIEGDESYEFTWVGKKASIAEANRPIQKTLRPCPEESVNWDTTENLYIEGDNLQVLKLLQKSYLGKIKMIYIDPPYNTGKDFVYNDNFAWSADDWDIKSGRIDEEGNHLFRNTESNGRFHSDWCSMMYSRLLVAYHLLADDGFIFISIDDNESDNLKKICDEVFGPSNYENTDYIQVRYPDKTLTEDSNYHKQIEQVLIYRKSEKSQPYLEPLPYDYDKFNYSIKELAAGKEIELGGKKVVIFERDEYEIVKHSEGFKDGLKEVWATGSILNGNSSGRFFRDYLSQRKEIDGLGVLYKVYDIGDDQFDYRYFTGPKKKDAEKGKYYQGVPTDKLEEGSVKTSPLPNYYDMAGDFGNIRLEGGVAFNNGKKPTKLLRHYLNYFNDTSITVLDFFSGSATTAHAVMQLNAGDGVKRNFIMVQLDENLDESLKLATNDKKDTLIQAINFLDSINKPHLLSELGKERIRRAGKKIKEENPLTTLDLDVGFRVLKLDDWNKKDVEKTPAETSQADLLDFTDNLRDDRSDLDLLFGCLIDSGLELTKPITSEDIEGCAVYSYNEDWLIGCFAENVPDSVIRQIASRKPRKAIFRDSSFADSPSKINVTEVFKMISPDTQLRVI